MKFTFLIAMLLMASAAQAQLGGLLGDKLYFGGGFGFSAGSNYTNISVSPLVGYKITERLSSGVMVQYQYNKFNDASLSHYGLSPFTRFMITQQFFAHAEYEHLTVERFSGPRLGFNSLFVGGGFVQPLGRVASFTLVGLYNLLYDESADLRIYGSPFIVRGGINVGF